MSKNPSRSPDARYVIPLSILKEMASVCTRDEKNQKIIYKKLCKNTEARQNELKKCIVMASQGLGWRKSLPKRRAKRAKALKDIDKTIKLSTSLEKLLAQIGEKRWLHQEYLEYDIYHYLGKDLSDAFRADLKKQIDKYEEIKPLLKKRPKTWDGKYLQWLTDFIYQIALLYQQSTGKDFTVNEDKWVLGKDNVLEPTSLGMKFAQKSLKVIYDLSRNNERYTDKNFKSACGYVRKMLNKQ